MEIKKWYSNRCSAYEDWEDIVAEFFTKVKEFNFTKYLLDKKERSLQSSIMLKEGLVEQWTLQIGDYENSISVNESLIIQTEKEIKELEKDVKKVVKVINLYIV